MAVTLTIDIGDFGAESHPDDYVILYAPAFRESAERSGGLVSTAPRRVYLTGGKAAVEVEPAVCAGGGQHCVPALGLSLCFYGVDGVLDGVGHARRGVSLRGCAPRHLSARAGALRFANALTRAINSGTSNGLGR